MQSYPPGSDSNAVRDLRAARGAFINLFIAVAVSMIGLGIIVPILPLYAKSFGASGVSLGAVFATFPVARAIFGPLVGRLSDWIGRRRLILVGLAGYTALSILYIIASALWQLGLLRFLQGFASVLVTPVAQAYVGDLTPPGKEGRYINIFYTSMFFGMALGPFIGGTLSEAWSMRAAFCAMGALSFLALVLALRYVPADSRSRFGSGEPRPRITPFGEVIRGNAVKAIAIFMATRGFWRQGFNTFYPIFAAIAVQFGEAEIGVILSVYMVAGGLLQVPFGYLADRLPRLPQIGLGGLLAPLTLLLVPFVGRMDWVILLVFLMGAMSALARGSVLAIRTEAGRSYGMGTVAGLHGGAFSAGQFLGPLGFGVIADFFGIGAVFPFGGAIGLIGACLGLFWFHRWQKAGRAG